MFVMRNHDGYVEVSIVLSNGTTIGTGYGPSLETAAYFACRHAARTGNRIAAHGHARYLSESHETIIRSM